MKIEIVDYFDVWGNQEDGWEVNDVIVHRDIEVETSESIFEKLIDMRLIPQDSEWEDYQIMDWVYGFELIDKQNDLPICAVYFVEQY